MSSLTGAAVTAIRLPEMPETPSHVPGIEETLMELLVETGRGYSPADSRDDVPVDMIPIDAMYTPVPKVNYIIEHTRVGQMTDYDRLLLEIWTDGSLQPDDALSQAARILTQYAASVAGYGRDSADLGLEEMVPAVEEDVENPDEASPEEVPAE